MSLEQELKRLSEMESKLEESHKQVEEKQNRLKLITDGVTEKCIDCDEQLEELENKEKEIDRQLALAEELGLKPRTKAKIGKSKK